MNPAKEVGGDFYDFFLIDDDHIALVIADVSDKGVPTALFMVIAKTMIKNHAQLGEYFPEKVLSQTNEQLCEGNEAGLFVTVWLAIIQLSTGKGAAANAGHEHPALRHRDGQFELVKYRILRQLLPWKAFASDSILFSCFPATVCLSIQMG